ncbi:undecaprenyl/decaprenyl-phosphate alpha-N-acetylglucosaminyl 1-phosphate transferase [Arcanobacterium phocisimile]|uniref:Undecaprenyl/decaprenyl-phosphate alpha-N-acetylglucosaminyl 1-phosphate transferase n=1 Tax=Arcanobacterium phocisimile TaxID=1302235 RepID=A0ABX7IHP9_9ACTO|nr:MraY family glycosyltransferase [Arcanobacterium phocisimile]QRV02506.1 undecaprenyl/decaprenyl-phosphate alpha-N-acetylglucosaminyl 1-phosphate transferase [Arcanobacterium phocisimile]
MRAYLLIMVIAGIVTYLLVPVVHRAALAAGAITEIRARDVHKVPIARLGGVAMYLGFVISLVIASQIPYFHIVLGPGSMAWAVVAGAGIICAIGVIDDIYELPWYAKLAGQMLAAGVMVWYGVQLVSVPLLGITVGSARLTLFVTIVAVVVVVNAVNFIDGLDGLAAGVVGIAALAFFAYTYYLTRETSPGDFTSIASALVAPLVGICIGFLPHNFHPAKIFMGDSGALMLGTIIAGASIVVTGQIDPVAANTPQAIPAYMPLIVPLLVLIIPIVDLVWGVVRRVAKGKSPFSADAGHLHHRLLRHGHSHTNAVLVLYMWTAVASFSAVSAVAFPLRWVLPASIFGVLIAIAVTFQVFAARRARAVARLKEAVHQTIHSKSDVPTES